MAASTPVQFQMNASPFARRLPERRLAFVLEGGASAGAYQVGMLQALMEAGIRPDLVIGTSAGALNAAAYAADPTTQGLRNLASAWTSVRRRDVFPIDVLDVARGPRRPLTLAAYGYEQIMTHHSESSSTPTGGQRMRVPLPRRDGRSPLDFSAAGSRITAAAATTRSWLRSISDLDLAPAI